MPLRVTELRVPVGTPFAEVRAAALKRAGISEGDVEQVEIVRRSVDRRRRIPVFSFTLDLHLREGFGGHVPGPTVSWVEASEVPDPPVGEAALEAPPVVVGAGPAGLYAALWLAQKGYRPLVLERGDPMNLRVRRIRDLNRDGVLDPESNYLFGEGGAGTFSDGKLTSRSRDPLAGHVLRDMQDRSGVEGVTWDYRPHLGSDRIRTVVGRLRRDILALGGTLKFRCRVLGVVERNGNLVAVRTSEGDIPATTCVLAPGHSARALYASLLASGVPLEQKPFQMGLRVEHPQSWADDAIWGPLAKHPDLGPAEYRMSVRVRGVSVYSFCMCPGGEIIPAVSDLGYMNTNGMSWSGRATGFANSGVVTTLEPSAFPGDGPLAGVEWQAEFERRGARSCGGGLAVPGQRLLDWLERRPSADLPASSCRTGVVPADLRSLVPEGTGPLLDEALRRMHTQMPGFLHPDALLVGPEARSSAPVRILRDPMTLQSLGVSGLYPVGEGAGYAGGIVSSAVDGLRAARALTAAWAVPVGS